MSSNLSLILLIILKVKKYLSEFPESNFTVVKHASEFPERGLQALKSLSEFPEKGLQALKSPSEFPKKGLQACKPPSEFPESVFTLCAFRFCDNDELLPKQAAIVTQPKRAQYKRKRRKNTDVNRFTKDFD